MNDHLVPWIRLAGVALLFGCGATSSGHVVPQLTPEPESSRRECHLSGTPGSIHELVDSTRAVRELSADDVPDGGVVYSFARDSTGEITRFRLVQATVDSATAERLRQSLESLAGDGSRNPAESRSGRLLVRWEEGKVISLRVGPSRACRPKMINQERVSRMLERVRAETGLLGSARARIFVDTAGVPAEVKIHQGTGSVALDQQLFSVAQRLRFDPASMDGHLLSVWVELDLTVERPSP